MVLALGPFQPVSNGFSELFEVVKVMTANLKDDRPIDVLITMDSDVSEPHCFGHSFFRIWINNLQMCQDHEVLCHCAWWSCFGFGNDMGCEIHAKLYCALKVQRDDVLQIRIESQLLGG